MNLQIMAHSSEIVEVCSDVTCKEIMNELHDV
jgi:hypothetical protein